MKKILLMIMSGISLGAMPAQAQFNTVATVPSRYRVEVLRADTEKTKPTPESAVPGQDASTDVLASAPPVDIRKKMWIDRYLGVCYPLRNIQINSPYGYRKDPFTGKKKFHGGIDLHARGDEVLAMMEGVVVKVGQDKTSGKYVTLRQGNYTVSYCHLSQVFVIKGAVIRPRDVVGITGSTGRSTGEHLHITCRLDGKNIDPLILFDYIKSTQQQCVAALAEL
ncbi:M23 family metallopeptidase [Bacteroides hominis]|uniref:M23 family metallopeptidase n=1 Tax=Bacteroides hominis TaxID=2763023 RepID=UPI00164AAE6D|nr:M23 family metallopeptidase [Bacteroides hominis (ex Liu et al. 2022)]MBC5614587.1 M23 family metallopeptidase [Bacteroides hominis (ex Liu et al. 2022)]